MINAFIKPLTKLGVLCYEIVKLIYLGFINAIIISQKLMSEILCTMRKIYFVANLLLSVKN